MDLYTDAFHPDGRMEPDEVGHRWDGTLQGAVDYADRVRRAPEHSTFDSGWRFEQRVADSAEAMLRMSVDGSWNLLAGTGAGARRLETGGGTLVAAMTALRDRLEFPGQQEALDDAVEAALVDYGLKVGRFDCGTTITVVETRGDELQEPGEAEWWNGQVWAAARMARAAQRKAMQVRPDTAWKGTEWHPIVEGTEASLLAVDHEGRVARPRDGACHTAVRRVRYAAGFDGAMQALRDLTTMAPNDRDALRACAQRAVAHYGFA